MIFPAFSWRKRRSMLSTGQRMAMEHSAWLTRVLGSRHQPPRIPVRKVSEGGFAAMMATPSGRFRAERWWERTLARDET